MNAKHRLTPWLRMALAVFAMVILTACGTFYSRSPEPPPDTFGDSADYLIGISDSLTIHVWRNPDLSLTTRVRPDGHISMPLMADLRAEGRQPRELAEQITEALSEVIRNPEVTVIVADTASNEYRHRVRVTGQVMSQSSLPYRPGMTVLDLVVHAGGLTEFAAGNRATLQRYVAGEYRRYNINLTAILENGDLRTNYQLNPGDVISVPQKRLLRGEF